MDLWIIQAKAPQVFIYTAWRKQGVKGREGHRDTCSIQIKTTRWQKAEHLLSWLAGWIPMDDSTLEPIWELLILSIRPTASSSQIPWKKPLNRLQENPNDTTIRTPVSMLLMYELETLARMFDLISRLRPPANVYNRSCRSWSTARVTGPYLS